MTKKQQIIDEILSLEPELKTKEKDLQKLIDIIIKNKPNVKISNNFRNELKTRLLKFDSNTKFTYSKINYFQIITWFFVWWVTAFSVAWIIWINFDTIWELEKWLKEPMMMSIEEDFTETEHMWKSKEMSLKSRSSNIIMENDAYISEGSISDSLIENKILELELKIFFEKNGIDFKYLDDILDIINTYLENK